MKEENDWENFIEMIRQTVRENPELRKRIIDGLEEVGTKPEDPKKGKNLKGFLGNQGSEI